MLKRYIPKAIGLGINLSNYIVPSWSTNLAFKFFGTPRSGRLRPKDNKYLSSAEVRDAFTTEYGDIQYYIWNRQGEKTILLLHGWESNSARWQSLNKHLIKENYCVISIDAPAHGASSNSNFDMLQYIAAIDKAVQLFNPNALLGHSVGGASLGFYLSEYDFPNFDQLILLGAPTELTQMVGNFSAALGLSKRSLRLLNELFVKKFNRTIDSISASKMVKGVKIPTLIIHAKNDAVISYKDAETYDGLFEKSKLVITEKYGHGLQHKFVYKEIVNFLLEKHKLQKV